jgi:NAD(P)-dependent dehydrogenase (short-subunit alcohol dehydrogenase family)
MLNKNQTVNLLHCRRQTPRIHSQENNMILKDKVTLLTGAASGIGRAIALAAAREGAVLLAADVDEAGGRETVRLIEQQRGKAVFVALDATNPAQHEEVVKQALDQFGRLDVAFNNAGISLGRSKLYRPLAQSSLEDWHDILNLNLHGVYYGMRVQIPAMLAGGGGAIVNTASIMGQVGSRNSSAYVTSKHAVVGLTKCAALEYAEQGIRVNAIAPGFIDTPILNRKTADEMVELAARHPLKRLGKAEEVAELAIWLASDRASFATGGYYPVDGGYLAQ